MSQLPFSGKSGFSPPVQSPDYYETKSIFVFRVKLKGSFLHSELADKVCWRKLGACDGSSNGRFQGQSSKRSSGSLDQIPDLVL